MLENGAEVSCPPPFNLQETAREAGGFIKRLDETADRLNAAIADVRRLVLNEETLTNLSATVGNMRVASERAISTIDSLDAVIAENGPKLGISASNIVSFSSEMSQLAGTLGEVIQTNSTQLTAAMQNIASASESLKSLADDLKTGKGLVGTLIKNETLANNVQTLAANLSITSSNLNRVGIWGILWAQKPPRTNAPAPRSAGKK
jgi:chromosome segregation ATPase